jgi:general stress protein 26
MLPRTYKILRPSLSLPGRLTLSSSKSRFIEQHQILHYRYHTPKFIMSYSNTSSGTSSADPYKSKNLDNDTTLKEKIEDLVSFAEKQKFCMMTTRIADSGLLASRCMALAAKEGNGVDFIFHSNSESGKTDDLKSDSDINLSFLNSSGEWASIGGKASIISDRDAVRKYYSPALKAWIGDLGDGKHDGGPEDPRIVLIKVKAITAQYALSRRTAVGSAIELAKGVVTGEAPSVNKLRQISESEIQQWRSQ